MPIGIHQHCHVRKCLWGFIYLFLAGFRFAFFFTACNENSQEYKLKQLYHVLSLDINTRKHVFHLNCLKLLIFYVLL